MDFEKAKEIAEKKAKEYGKIIVYISENDEYWYFGAGFEDGTVSYDNGAGSVYISKKDGSEEVDYYYLSEFNQNFEETAKEIYNMFDKQ